VRFGWSVHLPNTGGQWATNFAEPAVIVEAVASSAEQVRALTADVLARVHTALTRLEDETGVAPINRIVLALSPQAPVVLYIAGSAKRAATTVIALGLATTWAFWARLRWRGTVRDASVQPASIAIDEPAMNSASQSRLAHVGTDDA
jgi:hypothetical protein